MGRESYDDMVASDRRPRRSGSSKTGLIAIFGILVCAIAVLVVLILSPAESTAEDASAQTPVTVDIREPEIIESSQSTTAQPVEEPVVQAPIPLADTTPAVTSQSIRPSASTQTSTGSGRTTAMDLVSAQNLAAFNDADILMYITHTVQEGEDLSSIAAAYGLNMNTLISVNRIRNLSAIVPGVELQIPNMDGQIYTVQEGDMLSTIARRFNPELGWKRLMDVNGLSSENIRVGQELFIPDMQRREETSLQEVDLSFSSPISGTVYASFGQYYNGMSLDGVLIGSTAGSAVLASEKGVVVDAGRTDGMGRFLIIQHDQGYRTLYYNLETVNTTIGSEVERGQIIGAIGPAGQSFTRPTLYFQIEQGGISLNPSLFI